jgi:hypothetical protein
MHSSLPPGTYQFRPSVSSPKIPAVGLSTDNFNLDDIAQPPGSPSCPATAWRGSRPTPNACSNSSDSLEAALPAALAPSCPGCQLPPGETTLSTPPTARSRRRSVSWDRVSPANCRTRGRRLPKSRFECKPAIPSPPRLAHESVPRPAWRISRSKDSPSFGSGTARRVASEAGIGAAAAHCQRMIRRSAASAAPAPNNVKIRAPICATRPDKHKVATIAGNQPGDDAAADRNQPSGCRRSCSRNMGVAAVRPASG